jgi:hypothetical protein
MRLFQFIFCIIVTSPTASFSSSLEYQQGMVVYPIMNEVLSRSAFRLLFVDLRRFQPGFVSKCHVDLHCGDDDDMNKLDWEDNFQWAQTWSIPKSDSSAVVVLHFMDNKSPPVLHITGEEHVVLVCKVVALDHNGNVLASASSRFSIRNQCDSASDFGGAESMKPHTFEQRVDRRSELDEYLIPPRAKWSEYHVEGQGLSFESETWKSDQRDWRKWTSDAAMAAARYVFESHSGAVGLCDGQILENNFDFPVFVMNLHHRRDKRLHMERLLCDLGFSNVSFPTTTHADDLDIASLILAGVVAVEAVHGIIDRHGARALRPYIANAVDRIRTLERAARDGHQLFGVFEDDLVAGACPAETNRRIASALRELPPDADV